MQPRWVQRVAGAGLASGLLWTALAAPAPPAAPLQMAEVIAHMARTIAWYRHIAAAGQSAQLPADVLEREAAQRVSTRALQLAFDFARASAPLVRAPQAAGARPPASAFNVDQASRRAAERISTLEGRIAEVDAALARAGARTRSSLTARRRELQAELNLAKQIRDSIQGMRAFLTSQTGGGADLASYIDRLERSVPEAMRGTQPAAPLPPAKAASAESPYRPESAGILKLVTEAFRMARARSLLRDALDETETLQKHVDEIRAPLVNDLRNAIRRSDTVSADSSSQTAEQMDADRQEIEALTVRFKQVSAALAPLREQNIQVQTLRNSLTEARNAVEQRYAGAVNYLLFRALGLVIMIAVVLGISELWRRGTFRYVRDARRRKQFLTLRRVVVTCVVAAMIVMGLASEFGSLATYAGFLTAGLAVALQNVILSIVAYFFLIGRYGVRVGDRVTISNVTGDVLDIGLVRIYLMEMAGGPTDLHATGRVVAFSNSVVFQPAALFKQMPGTDYVWHTVSLTLAPESDLQLAQTRLMAAVESVFEQYRERIDQQHAAFQRSVDVPLAPPRPEGRLRFTDAGLEFQVRYPAELHQASAIGDQVVKALGDAIAREPRLALAGSGAPKLRTAV
ncbi:MAG: mechanosensitive ion channel [Bryobacterales bacterium]|nr:mechanosensitive ion channel [Bryobacterales bacterium]